MKKIVVAILVMVVLTGSFAAVWAEGTAKPRVAVIVVDARNNRDWANWGSNTPYQDISQVIDSVLGQSGQFEVVSREWRQETWSEQDMPVGRMDPSTVTSIGQTKGAEYFLVIYIRHFNCSSSGVVGAPIGNVNVGLVWYTAKLIITAKMVSVATSTVVWPSQPNHTTEFSASETATVTGVGYNGMAVGWASSPSGKATQKVAEKLRGALVSEFIPTYVAPAPPAPPPSLSELQTQTLALPEGSGTMGIYFYWSTIQTLGPKPGDWVIVLNANNRPIGLIRLIKTTQSTNEALYFDVEILRGNIPQGGLFNFAKFK